VHLRRFFDDEIDRALGLGIIDRADCSHDWKDITVGGGCSGRALDPIHHRQNNGARRKKPGRKLFLGPDHPLELED
jgi:hypothetical protein